MRIPHLVPLGPLGPLGPHGPAAREKTSIRARTRERELEPPRCIPIAESRIRLDQPLETTAPFTGDLALSLANLLTTILSTLTRIYPSSSYTVKNGATKLFTKNNFILRTSRCTDYCEERGKFSEFLFQASIAKFR